MSMTVRAPAVAGSFYPADPAMLDRMVGDFLAQADGRALSAGAPVKAIAGPHAGYVYSGPIAGTAYASVRHLADRVTRVVLLGPAHRYAFRGIAMPTADGLATPLGVVRVDRAVLEAIRDLPGVQTLDAAFDGEHGLEVHLPFIQRIFPQAGVVPLVVGGATPDQVEAVLERLWGGPETLIVVSTDLSHFLDHDTASARDLETSRIIEAAEPDLLSGERACGYLPLSGLLRRARRLDLRATTLDLRNSGDTAGDRRRVVGYGAYSFEEAEQARLSDAHREMLLDTAAEALHRMVKTGHKPAVEAQAFPLPLRALRRTFVTLELGGHLRGCIGTVMPADALVEDVVGNTLKSASRDPRFTPLTIGELAGLSLTVSVLSHSRPIAFEDEADLLEALRPGLDGLILRDGPRGALYLPKVWSMLPDPRDFLRHLKVKAGLPARGVTPTLQAFRFTAETFGTA
jgi:AmmeMemoRadiSam system protein B/AmmeMemoRadiSam system protein A